MKKRGATIKHKAAAHSRMIVHHVLPKYEMGLKNAAYLFRIGEAGPAQYDDLVDTMDMMRLGIAVYPAQKRDETAEAVAEMSVTTLSAIRARWVETEKISATEDEQQVLDALVTVSFDYWNRRSSALYTEARRQLIEARKKQHQDYLKETEMNARDNAPALPAIDGIINAAHKALADFKAPLCAEDVAKSINGTKRATKPQIKEAEKQLKELYGLGILESQTRTGGVSFYSLTVAPAQEAKTGNPVVEDDGCGACGDACASNGGDCRVKEESPPVCESVQAGGESQTEDSPINDGVRAQMQSLNTVAPDEFSLLNVIADIRAAIGDPEGKIMLGELASHIEAMLGTLVSKTAGLQIQTEEQEVRIGSLVTDVSNTRNALAHAINESDRLRNELIVERQAREALQEQDGVDVKDAAVGYLVRVTKRKPRYVTKPERARDAALAAVRAGAGRAEVLAVVPVGVARRGAEWAEAQ